MYVCYMVHGVNVWDGGSDTVSRFATFFEAYGHPSIPVDYGFTGIGAKRKNHKVARKLVDLVKPGSIGIGHSNGCAILHEAASIGAPFKLLIFINPALINDIDPPRNPDLKRIHVWHSPSDEPVKWAKWIDTIGLEGIFTPRPWGNMGAVGYTGDSPLFKNFNKETDYPIHSTGHSDVFDWEKLGLFGTEILNEIRIELGELNEDS